VVLILIATTRLVATTRRLGMKLLLVGLVQLVDQLGIEVAQSRGVLHREFIQIARFTFQSLLSRSGEKNRV
jgi:hypothetical protein